jgi:hypothetical protein
MAHFAKVSGGTVTQVIVAEPEFFNTFVYPNDGKYYRWNEETTSWSEVVTSE